MTPFIFHCSFFFSGSVTGLWTTGEKKAKFGYDYWYQPYWDIMISTEWGAPKSFKKGFSLPDTQDEGSAPVANIYFRICVSWLSSSSSIIIIT